MQTSVNRLRRVGIAILVIVGWPSHADEVPARALSDALVSLPSVVDGAARIARIRITARTPVGPEGLIKGSRAEQAWKNSVCGFYLDATVIEGLKGGSDPFSFFSPVNSDFDGFDREYLVFAMHRSIRASKEAVKAVSDLLSLVERDRVMCEAFGELYVPVWPQLLRSFDPEANKMFGGNWLAPPNRTSIQWCEDFDGRKRTGFLVERRKRETDPASSVTDWNGVKKLIQSSLGSWYRVWSDRVDGC